MARQDKGHEVAREVAIFMEWQDKGIIIGVKPHGETSLIVELMTRGHGRHKGLVKGGRSRRQMPLLQPGNRVEAHWQARLAEHMGLFRLEGESIAAPQLMASSLSLYALQTMADFLRLLPERDPYPELYDILPLLLGHFDTPLLAGEIFMRFELRLLAQLGFGLDLSRCAASGKKGAIPEAEGEGEGAAAGHNLAGLAAIASPVAEPADKMAAGPLANNAAAIAEETAFAPRREEETVELAYVSPRTGRAVGRIAGAPWRDKLLPLPPFLLNARLRARNFSDIAAAARLTGFFLMRNVFEPRGLTPPPFRESFLTALAAAAAESESETEA